MHANLFTLSQHRFQAKDQPHDFNITLFMCSHFRFSLFQGECLRQQENVLLQKISL